MKNGGISRRSIRYIMDNFIISHIEDAYYKKALALIWKWRIMCGGPRGSMWDDRISNIHDILVKRGLELGLNEEEIRDDFLAAYDGADKQDEIEKFEIWEREGFGEYQSRWLKRVDGKYIACRSY